MAEPTSEKEYNERCIANARTSGFGLDVTQHFPCPFCSAPEWLAVKILQFEQVAAEAHLCGECGRSGKILFKRSENSTSFEFVQTAGPDPAPWVPIRREVPSP